MDFALNNRAAVTTRPATNRSIIPTLHRFVAWLSGASDTRRQFAPDPRAEGKFMVMHGQIVALHPDADDHPVEYYMR